MKSFKQYLNEHGDPHVPWDDPNHPPGYGGHSHNFPPDKPCKEFDWICQWIYEECSWGTVSGGDCITLYQACGGAYHPSMTPNGGGQGSPEHQAAIDQAGQVIEDADWEEEDIAQIKPVAKKTPISREQPPKSGGIVDVP